MPQEESSMDIIPAEIVMIQYVYLIVCFISFNLFMDLFLSFHIATLIRHVEVTDHMICPFFILMQSMDNPWIFPYQQFPMISLISINSYAFYFFPYLLPPIHMIGAVHTSIVMATCQPYLFNTCFYDSFPFYYYIILCTILL